MCVQSDKQTTRSKNQVTYILKIQHGLRLQSEQYFFFSTLLLNWNRVVACIR